MVKMKHASRKNKSSWRKNISTDDVDSFLEEERESERIGSVADKSDAELFVEEVRPQDTKNQQTKKSLRRKAFGAVPKYCAALENTSRVPDPNAKRNRVTNPEKLRKAAEKREAIVKRLSFRKPLARSAKNVTKDLWAEEEATPLRSDEWINNNVVLHHMKNTGKPLVKTADSTHRKPNAVINIELPAKGASYNPSIDDYNELKQAVIEGEKKILKREAHLKRVVTDKFTRLTNEQRSEMLAKEMGEGLFDQEEKAQNGGEESDGDYKAVNAPVVNKKKDRKTKNKQFRAVAKRNAATALAGEVKKLKDINRLTELSSKICKSEKKTKAKQERRVVRLEEKKLQPGRVAYMKFEEPEQDFLEPTELSDALRTVAPNRSLIVDRFKSFQKREMIAPKKHRDGIPRSNRSTLKKWKRYTMNSHKE